jgi:2-polyprenyl-3-methyl-5-hydroxy-6-metoxy-1,4-benzoquinol methylase
MIVRALARTGALEQQTFTSEGWIEPSWRPRMTSDGVMALSAEEAEYRARIYERYVRVTSSNADAATVRTISSASNPYLAKVIRDHFPEGRAATILDLGCGDGSFLRELRRAGYRNLAGVDRSAEQVAGAARRGETGVRLGDLLHEARTLPDASHDVIITFDVLEHLRREELLALADQVLRALRPGGRWVIHVPNAESPFFGRIRYGDVTHEQAFTRGSLRQLFEAVGFNAVMCHEDTPVVHGAKSAVRFALWKMIRLGLRAYLAAETGESGPEPIFSQNLLAIVQR